MALKTVHHFILVHKFIFNLLCKVSVSGTKFLDGIGGPKNLLKYSLVKMQNHRITLLYVQLKKGFHSIVP